ncbi:rho GTPase-activating protein 36 isoform X1 [Anomalospiza imberbis]|uniref:rho GTPase-activating protein 36 isoform X1 n=2 Tax=Anomalospiza imberbis TaxID=187417 RepID=UPI00358E2BFB
MVTTSPRTPLRLGMWPWALLECGASPAQRCVFQRTFGSPPVPGPSPGMQPVALQSLSELERASLQELALFQLQERLPVGHLSLDRDGSKGIKSIRQKLESFSKERKDCSPHTFGVPLPQVIANDRACRQLQEAVGKSRRLCLEVEATVTRFRAQRQKRLGMGTSCIRAPDGGFPEEPLSPALLDKSSWSQRRGAMSVDSITDLSDNASELLEALQLSHPHELDPRRSRGKKKPLSLNPITWQVPRIVDRCCTHLETHGLQTVGIFRVGSSKKRVQQLREEFDRGLDVFLDEHQTVHDVAALLKEFLRDMPDSLIPRELYGAFLSTATLEGPAQLDTLQLLLFLLPPCHSDTLLRLLRFLARVARHAESSWDPEGREIPGNKMTVSNLATVFGPNILQKEKPGEKDASTLNFEDSAAIILVLQRLIEHHHSLFMVSPEMQCDVLRRLFQTDPDVIEYLLRRKFPDVPSPEREDRGEDPAPSALPGWTRSLERGSVSSELYSNVSFLNLDVGI